jgi:hypothetical protein
MARIMRLLTPGRTCGKDVPGRTHNSVDGGCLGAESMEELCGMVGLEEVEPSSPGIQ